MADTPLHNDPTSKEPGESPRAFYAFQKYRDASPRARTLESVTRQLALEQRGSGLRIVKENEPRTVPKGHSGQVSAWSRKFHWVDRAAAWDAILDQRVRQKQIHEIEAMAKRQAGQAQLALETLMAPVMALARALRDPNRLVDLESAKLADLMKLSSNCIKAVPRLQKAERLARGVKVVDHDAHSQPGSTQGGHEWNITVYQPERSEPEPSLDEAHAGESDEWEEAK